MANRSANPRPSRSPRSSPTRSSPTRSGGGALSFLLGVVLTLAMVLGGGWVYLRYGHPPVAVTDPAFPMEARIVHTPLESRIAHEIQQPPFGIGEDVYEAGAKVYVNNCSGCHGTPGHDAAFAKALYPPAPQLWKKHPHGAVVGVSDDPAGETFWKIENGIRLSGMPSYRHTLTPTQMWQVSLLLKNADQTLPEPVSAILRSTP